MQRSLGESLLKSEVMGHHDEDIFISERQPRKDRRLRRCWLLMMKEFIFLGYDFRLSRDARRSSRDVYNHF